jgi:hypothetical protein
LAATITPTAETRPARAACGVELWSLKTLSDPQRRLVNLHPRGTSVAAINALLPTRPPLRDDALQFVSHTASHSAAPSSIASVRQQRAAPVQPFVNARATAAVRLVTFSFS